VSKLKQQLKMDRNAIVREVIGGLYEFREGVNVPKIWTPTYHASMDIETTVSGSGLCVLRAPDSMYLVCFAKSIPQIVSSHMEGVGAPVRGRTLSYHVPIPPTPAPTMVLKLTVSTVDGDEMVTAQDVHGERAVIKIPTFEEMITTTRIERTRRYNVRTVTFGASVKQASEIAPVQSTTMLFHGALVRLSDVHVSKFDYTPKSTTVARLLASAMPVIHRAVYSPTFKTFPTEMSPTSVPDAMRMYGIDCRVCAITEGYRQSLLRYVRVSAMWAAGHIHAYEDAVNHRLFGSHAELMHDGEECTCIQYPTEPYVVTSDHFDWDCAGCPMCLPLMEDGDPEYESDVNGTPKSNTTDSIDM